MKENEETKVLNNCIILGFKPTFAKDTLEEKLIIQIAIKTYDKDYIGDFPIQPIWLDNKDNLKEKLINYLRNPQSFVATYEIRPNIITGKTKISNLIIEEQKVKKFKEKRKKWVLKNVKK